MKKLRNLIAVMAVMSLAAGLTGCGDEGGDDDDNNNNPNPNPTFAPADQAALTAQNKVYTVNVAGQDPLELTFPSAGTYQLKQGANTETGTITATKNGETWTIQATPNAGTTGRQGALALSWTAANTGSFTFTPADGSAPSSGTFSVVDNSGNPTNGGPGGGTTGTTTNGLPTTVEGKVLQVSYPSTGGGEKFTFTSTNNVTYEDPAQGISGTYTYDQAAGRVSATMNNGWVFNITLSSTSNNATVDFQENPNAPVTTSTGTYTLQ
jgi:large repetitive protein